MSNATSLAFMSNASTGQLELSFPLRDLHLFMIFVKCIKVSELLLQFIILNTICATDIMIKKTNRCEVS